MREAYGALGLREISRFPLRETRLKILEEFIELVAKVEGEYDGTGKFGVSLESLIKHIFT